MTDGATSLDKYHYDDQRRLIDLNRADRGRKQITYAADNSAYVEEWFGMSTREAWLDPKGRVVRERNGGPGGGSEITIQHGEHGPTEQLSKYSYALQGQRRSVIQYDQDGRPVLEWMAEDTELSDGTSAFKRLATRRTYVCGTSDLVLEEFDGDSDGVVDRRIEYARDAAGNLLSETHFEGEARTRLVQYHYDCAR